MNARAFASNFQAVCATLGGIDLLGSLPPKPPWDGGRPVLADLRTRVDRGRLALPSIYGRKYVAPLLERLPALIRRAVADPAGDAPLEALAGAVYQHAPGYKWRPELRRFLALTSDLYRSFLRKRDAADLLGVACGKIPVREVLPPLATFAYQASGPSTYPVTKVRRRTGASVGVVSLPVVYGAHPILWAWIAHETGGHDVIRAVPRLLDELRGGVRRGLGRARVRGLSAGHLEALWSFWMNEAAADIYGVLNVGPMFGIVAAAGLAALRRRASQKAFEANPQVLLPPAPADPHPPDILRVHLALGAVESLVGLTAAKRRHVEELKVMAEICAAGDDLTILGPRHRGRRIQVIVPLHEMRESARRVGRYVATARLRALGGRSIQDVETWDDEDEAAAAQVGKALAARRAVGTLGDDAQLLAGAVMYLLNRPGDYGSVTAALAAGLDRSFARDPLWGRGQFLRGKDFRHQD